MNNIYTVVPCRTYKVYATQACTLTDGHGLTLQLEPGTPATFEAKTSEIHTTAPVTLEGGAVIASGKYVTVQIRGVKKKTESTTGGDPYTLYLTSASGWGIIDPQNYLINMQMVCGFYCKAGWLFRELWERPSADTVTEEVLIGWEFVLRAGEEEYILEDVAIFANSLASGTAGVHTLHVKKIYHD